MEGETSESRPMRALALDALRGLAILMMCLSGRVPFGSNTLPSWMYHAQAPPPTNAHNSAIAGYTWVDLVFPLFLFSMGVAFPFAQMGRIQRGVPRWRIVLGALWRALLLAAFAIYFNHIVPYSIDAGATARAFMSFLGVELAPAYTPGASLVWIIGLIGFLVLIPVYTRFPKDWRPSTVWALRAAGILAAVLFLYVVRFPNQARFSLYRSNIILIVLANMAFFGTTVWLLTRNAPLLRLGFLALFYPIFEAAKISGSELNALIWDPIPKLDWLYSGNYLKYLFVVVPGTLVGDELMRWMKSPPEERTGGRWTTGALAMLSAVLLALVVFVHTALQARWLFAGTFIPCAVWAGLLYLTASAGNATERFLQYLVRWGGFWLVAGLFFEPVSGGIKKDPSNMSYYLVSVGLSSFLLVCLTIWIDLFQRRFWFGFLIDNGQNPMLAYVGINNLMEPVLALPFIWLSIPVGSFADQSPWHALVWALFKTGVLAGLVSLFTRWKIIWRT